MNHYPHTIREPIRRPKADAYLLLALLSFALSVSLTRLFLELTGYPQIGGSEFHVAHVLWGGLLLFIAAMLPLVYANRWVYTLVAVLTGMGIGLFIDEVGKFITQNNDYFYPPAAPIIYAFFLICVLLYLRLRHPLPRNPRAELYAALEMMEDVLDHDLDADERADLQGRLGFVMAQKEYPELTRLARNLQDFLEHEQIYIAPSRPGFLKRLGPNLRAFERRYFDQARLQVALTIGLGGMGSFALVTSTRAVVTNLRPDLFEAGLALVIQNTAYNDLYWFFALHVFQVLLGLAILLGAIYLLRGLEKGVEISFFGLLLYLTMVDLLLFYYYQFSTIVTAVFQFILLLGVLYYRQTYLVRK